MLLLNQRTQCLWGLWAGWVDIVFNRKSLGTPRKWWWNWEELSNSATSGRDSGQWSQVKKVIKECLWHLWPLSRCALESSLFAAQLFSAKGSVLQQSWRHHFRCFFCQRSVNLMPWQLVMGELLLRFGHQGFRFHFVPSGDFARLAYRTPSITAVSRPPIRVFTNAISFRVFSIIVSGSCN